MFAVHFRSSLFSDPANKAADEKALLEMIDGLVWVNIAYLTSHPNTPDVYDAGVVYIPEQPGVEIWGDIGHVLQMRGGDCEDLVAWRCAYLRFHGIDKGARPRLLVFPRWCRPAEAHPCALYHVQVQRSGFRQVIEDPSAKLGMPTGHVPQGVI